MSCYKEYLDKMTWSYSRLSTYAQCPYCFYLMYIEDPENRGESNFYADNGKLMHEILEKLAKGELSFDDAPGYYIEEFEYIKDEYLGEVQESIMDSTFEKCNDYLCEISPGVLEKYDILGVELKISFKIGRKIFIGYIDLLLRDKNNGEIILLDHKSRNRIMKKDGKTPLKSEEKNFIGYKRQLYLYSKAVFEKYGEFPKKLVWHHFKNHGELTVIDFDMSEYNDTIEWTKKMFRKIWKDEKFESCDLKNNWFYCNNICDYRKICDYKDSE